MTKLHNRGGKRESTKPKPAKTDQDNNRKVIAFTIEPDILTRLDTEASELKISRSEAVNRILLDHFSPNTPQVNQSEIEAMRSTIEAMHSTLKQVYDIAISKLSHDDIAGMVADIERETGPVLPVCLADVLELKPGKFGQWIVDNLPPLDKQIREQLKAPWQTADPHTLNGLRQYGNDLIAAIKAGKIKLHPAQAQAFANMDDQTCRKTLINLAEIIDL